MTESQIQQTVIQYLSLIAAQKDFVFMAPMNEGVMMFLTIFKVPKLARIKIVQWLEKMGFRKGAADIQIFQNGKAYFIELKTASGTQSDNQKIFMKNVLGAGCEYAVCRSLDEVKVCLRIWGVM